MNIVRTGLYLLLGALAFWVICLILLLLPSDMCLFAIPSNITERAQLGDSFNIVNSFISLITLVFLIIGVFYEHSQYLKLLRDSKDSKNDSRIQNFESTFFKLLTLHNDVVNSTSVIVDNGHDLQNDPNIYQTIYGRNCFRYFF